MAGFPGPLVCDRGARRVSPAFCAAGRLKRPCCGIPGKEKFFLMRCESVRFSRFLFALLSASIRSAPGASKQGFFTVLLGVRKWELSEGVGWQCGVREVSRGQGLQNKLRGFVPREARKR